MNKLFHLIIFCFDPLGIGRRFLLRPALNAAFNIYDNFKVKADKRVEIIRDLLLRFSLIAFAVLLIVWTAAFMYAAFYYTYMPAISHTRPVHMQFRTCLNNSIPCTFPHAYVSLTKKQQLLMVGQAYKLIMNIEMPESPQNLELGMFMVCAEMRDHKSMLRDHSCRSAMMRYRSSLIRAISTWVLSPFYVLGFKEEYQQVPVELFSHYTEQSQHPITDIYVEIQSQKIQFSTVTLHIVADFTGLRYIMYNWPVIFAVVAISTNLFFILVVFLLSWYHWSDATWVRDLQRKYARFSSSLERRMGKDEDLNFLDDDNSNTSEIDISGEGNSSKEEDIKSSAEEGGRERRSIKDLF